MQHKENISTFEKILSKRYSSHRFQHLQYAQEASFKAATNLLPLLLLVLLAFPLALLLALAIPWIMDLAFLNMMFLIELTCMIDFHFTFLAFTPAFVIRLAISFGCLTRRLNNPLLHVLPIFMYDLLHSLMLQLATLFSTSGAVRLPPAFGLGLDAQYLQKGKEEKSSKQRNVQVLHVVMCSE